MVRGHVTAKHLISENPIPQNRIFRNRIFRNRSLTVIDGKKIGKAVRDMRIGAFDGFAGLYGNYRAQDIKTVDVETVRRQDAARLSEENERSSHTAGDEERQTPVHNPKQAGKIADLQDISLTFNKSDDFSYIGQDAALQSLDVEKAISDMKKDQVLEQYNYFVGNEQNRILSGEDGNVILK